jgi:hypothetical protein
MRADLAGIGKAWAQEFSGIRCQRDVAMISSWHREPGMQGYREAVNYAAKRAAEVGLVEVEFREFPWDGKHRFFDNWYTTPCWEPHEAGLWVVEPTTVELANAGEIPVTLGLRSGSTPEHGITSDLVYVGSGVYDKDYAGKDVRGKIVLMEPHGQLGFDAVNAARRHGVAGAVLCNLIDQEPYADRLDRPYMIGHVWTTHWYLGYQHDFQGEIFTFSVSHRQASWLKQLMAAGPVKVRAKVRATFRPGTAGTLTGVIRGHERPEEEVALLAHIDHPWPGANDNAAGCALLLEVARTMNALMESGRVPGPRRTVRFLWTVHLIGAAAWLEQNPGWAERCIAAFNCDSVGGYHMGNSRVVGVTRSSDVAPSFINDLVERLLDEVPSQTRAYLSRREPPDPHWVHTVRPYSRGSDHAPLNDNSPPVPCVSFGHFPYRWYHTDQDSVDHTDGLEFERYGWVVGLAATTVAQADSADALRLAHEVHSRSRKRLTTIAADALWRLADAEEADAVRVAAAVSDRLRYIAQRDRRAITQTRVLARGDGNSDGRIDEVERLGQTLEQVAADESTRLLATLSRRLNRDISSDLTRILSPTTNLEQECSARFPAKLMSEPVNFRGLQRTLEDRLGPERLVWMTQFIERLPYPVPTASGFPDSLIRADGRRSIWDIHWSVRHEQGWAPPLDVLQRFFADLVEAGLARWLNPDGSQTDDQ